MDARDKLGHDEKRIFSIRAVRIFDFTFAIARITVAHSISNKKMRTGEANMLRAVRQFFAFRKPKVAADEMHRRHLTWDRACRARGMTAREQADELQIRCAWVRLRTKASAAVLRKPARWRDILDRVAADEARTLAAIGGGELAATFLRAYEAAEMMEVLSPEAAFVVRAERQRLPVIHDAPSLTPKMPAGDRHRTSTNNRSKPKGQTNLAREAESAGRQG